MKAPHLPAPVNNIINYISNEKASGLLLLPAMVLFAFVMKDPLPLSSGIPKAANKLKIQSGRTKETCDYAICKSIGVVLLNAGIGRL